MKSYFANGRVRHGTMRKRTCLVNGAQALNKFDYLKMKSATQKSRHPREASVCRIFIDGREYGPNDQLTRADP